MANEKSLINAREFLLLVKKNAPYLYDMIAPIVCLCHIVDAVEVVRCKDCKWFGRDMGYGKHDCKKYEMPYCLADDFCSYGERKDNE